MSKFIKNITGSDLFHIITGTSFISNNYTEVDKSLLYLLNDSQLWGWFDDGSVIFALSDDGLNDVTNKYEGWHRLFNYSFGIPFLSNSNSDRNNGFTAESVQEAIEEASSNSTSKVIHHIQYQTIDTMDYSEYLFSGYQSRNNFNRRSGDRSNGYEYSNSAPPLCPIDGKVKKAIFAIKGVAQSTGTAASTVTVNFELWSVGFNGEGSKIDDITVDIDSSQYTIGNWWNSSINTDFKGSVSLDINVNEGDLLGLKFIRTYGSSDAIEIKNPTVVLRIEES